MRVAIAGATGLVGEMMRRVLEERNFPLSDFLPLASHRSEGGELQFRGKFHRIRELTSSAFSGVDVALFATEAEISRRFAPDAAKAGAVVIDNSSAFRMADDVPLVVPEVNPDALREHKGIIANPNCSTIQLVVVLWPIHTRFGLKRVVVSTYQSVSGKGKQALEELGEQMDAYRMEKGEFPYCLKPLAEAKILRYPIISNLIPQIDDFGKEGYTREEEKMINETRKIMSIPALRITVTCVRAPILFSHSESVNIETERETRADVVKSLLSESPGVRVVDDPEKSSYPLPLDAADKDLVYVGRIRRDPSTAHGLNMWVVSDNLRKGAATNAVQIAEKLLDLGLL